VLCVIIGGAGQEEGEKQKTGNGFYGGGHRGYCLDFSARDWSWKSISFGNSIRLVLLFETIAFAVLREPFAFFHETLS
jgi:hypothetical protein